MSKFTLKQQSDIDSFLNELELRRLQYDSSLKKPYSSLINKFVPFECEKDVFPTFDSCAKCISYSEFFCPKIKGFYNHEY